MLRHRRAADVLANTRTEHGGVLPLIAQHWLSAGEPVRARAAFLRAAQAALEVYARYDAYENAQEALKLDPPLEERFELLRIITKATDKIAEVEIAERALEEFERLAASLGRPAQFDALVARIRFHSNHGQRVAQSEACERLTRFVQAGDPRTWEVEAVLQSVAVKMQRGLSAAGENELARFDFSAIVEPRQMYVYHSTLAQSLCRQGKFEASALVLVTLRAILDQHPSQDGEWQYAYASHRLCCYSESSQGVLRSSNRLIELAQQRGDLSDEAAGRMDLAVAMHHLHDTSGARREYHRAMELWARARHWQSWANTVVNLGESEREIGHLDRAWQYFREAKERGLEAGARFAPIVADSNIAELELMQGDAQAALARVTPLIAQIAATGENRTIGDVDVVAGRIKVACGLVDEGIEQMRRGLETLRPMGLKRAYVGHLSYYVEALVNTGQVADLERAERELEDLFSDDPLEYASPAQIALSLASTARLRGDRERERSFMARGREAVLARLEALAEEEDRIAYAALHPNDVFLTRTAYATA